VLYQLNSYFAQLLGFTVKLFGRWLSGMATSCHI
jgi:hypothetical protein